MSDQTEVSIRVAKILKKRQDSWENNWSFRDMKEIFSL